VREDIVTKLAEARDELYEYDRMIETQMINGPEHVVDEMVSEIKRLRTALEFYSDDTNYNKYSDGYCPVLFDDGYRAREALNNGD